MPEEFTPEPHDYIPLWYKKNAVTSAEANPRGSLKSLHVNGTDNLRIDYETS